MVGQSCGIAFAMLEWLEVETGERSSLSGVLSVVSNGVGGVPSPVPPLSQRLGQMGVATERCEKDVLH